MAKTEGYATDQAYNLNLAGSDLLAPDGRGNWRHCRVLHQPELQPRLLGPQTRDQHGPRQTREPPAPSPRLESHPPLATFPQKIPQRLPHPHPPRLDPQLKGHALPLAPPAQKGVRPFRLHFHPPPSVADISTYGNKSIRHFQHSYELAGPPVQVPNRRSEQSAWLDGCGCYFPFHPHPVSSFFPERVSAFDVQEKSVQLKYVIIDALGVGVAPRALERQMSIPLEFSHLAAKCHLYVACPGRME